MAAKVISRATAGRHSPARRPQPTAGKHLNDALMHFLRAIPIGHLDTRMTEIEKWIGRLEKEVAKALAPPRRRTVAATRTPRATSRRTTRTGTAGRARARRAVR